MKTAPGYACDCCKAPLVEDIELDLYGARAWANMPEHICDMCVFGCTEESQALASESQP